jgi:hypothetical protein
LGTFIIFQKNDDDEFFKSKKKTTKSLLDTYSASNIIDATVYNGQCTAPLKQMALKLNTVLPASAAVERLFSCGGLIVRPHRNRLTDDHFESALLLKLNSKFNTVA